MVDYKTVEFRRAKRETLSKYIYEDAQAAKSWSVCLWGFGCNCQQLKGSKLHQI